MGYVLLVEDDLSVGKTVSRVLRGSRLVWKRSAEEALDELEAHPDAAVLLLDLNLKTGPMQGDDLIAYLAEHRPDLLASTYLMSGELEQDVEHRFSEPVRYIRKPVGIRVLRAAVQAHDPDPA